MFFLLWPWHRATVDGEKSCKQNFIYEWNFFFSFPFVHRSCGNLKREKPLIWFSSSSRSFVRSKSLKRRMMSMIDQREWNKLFPIDTNSFDASTLFIQRLFTVTLSTLTAKRRIFSSDHFSTKKFGRFNVPLFTRPESPIENQRLTKTVFSWVKFRFVRICSKSSS